jgi:Helix-turn-helix domain
MAAIGERVTAEDALAKVFAHPLRVKAWQMLNHAPSSPNQLALTLDEPLGNVAYHVRELEKFGCIELVDTKQRRGATEHFYRAIARPVIRTGEWGKLTPEERRPTSRYGMQLIVGDAISADTAGTFDSRPDRHLSRCPLLLDEQGWEKIAVACDDFLALVMKTQEESADRVADSAGEATAIPAVASLLFFERAPSPRR